MLDTNILSYLARDPNGPIAKAIAKVGDDAICASIITVAELRYGCAKKGSAKLLRQIEAILEGVDIIPFDIPADTAYGGIRAELEAAGKLIGPNDLLIAAHAQAVGATLVTANVDEFTRIRGLKVENWHA